MDIRLSNLLQQKKFNRLRIKDLENTGNVEALKKALEMDEYLDYRIKKLGGDPTDTSGYVPDQKSHDNSDIALFKPTRTHAIDNKPMIEMVSEIKILAPKDYNEVFPIFNKANLIPLDELTAPNEVSISIHNYEKDKTELLFSPKEEDTDFSYDSSYNEY